MTHLPSGTVTFLFTDIEGSTRLWERHPETMRTALARHDSLLREVVEACNGHIFKMVGDAVCAAFAAAPDALAAAVQAQLALQQEPWPEATTIRVRMALHTGKTQERDSDYFGPVVNRVARLLAVGHGGQTLLSAASSELLRDHLPPDIGLRDLGTHHLKDLERVEQIFQITHPDLPDTFPPLRSQGGTPNNLPKQVTTFIGREKEMRDVQALLGKTRLLTLTGAGGSGKTRLSLQVATETLDAYPDGVWLIELAPLTDPTLVPQTVAQAFGIKEEPGQSVEQTLAERLKERHLLLLLDNIEHVLTACARLAAALQRTCPRVAILTTSREPLGIAGEQVYRVPPLSLPSTQTAQTVTPEKVIQYEAVRLFSDRALLVRADFAVTSGNASAVVQLCHRLDGIPLAIELAAARVRSLSVEDINNRLDGRFRLLIGGDRSALPRQQTLRALVDWSYDLLNPQERLILTRLAVFSGGWTLEAAEAVCGFVPIEDAEILDLLTSLVDKSLVLAEEESGAIRYRLLHTIRQYALEKQEDSDEARTLLSRRHWEWFLALAEEAEPLLVGPDQLSWLTRLELEHDNLRAALAWCETATTDVPSPETDDTFGKIGLRLAVALIPFWSVRGYLSEGRKHLSTALDAARSRSAARTDTQTTLQAKALYGAGILAQGQGDADEARSLYAESLVLSRALHYRPGIAISLFNLGSLAQSQGDLVAARSLYDGCLALFREIGDREGAANALNGLGSLAYGQGDFLVAKSLYEEALSLCRELGDRRSIAASLGNLALAFWWQYDLESTWELYEEALALYREMGDKRGVVVTLNNLGRVAKDQGDYTNAQSLHEESLALSRDMGLKRGIATSRYCLGVVAHGQGDYTTARSLLEEHVAFSRESGLKRSLAATLDDLGNVLCDQEDYAAARAAFAESLVLFCELEDKQNIAYLLVRLAGVALCESSARKAVVLWAAAAALRDRIGALLPPSDQAKYDQQITQTRAALGEEAYAIAWEMGHRMSAEEAVAYALRRRN